MELRTFLIIMVIAMPVTVAMLDADSLYGGVATKEPMGNARRVLEGTKYLKIANLSYLLPIFPF